MLEGEGAGLRLDALYLKSALPLSIHRNSRSDSWWPSSLDRLYLLVPQTDPGAPAGQRSLGNRDHLPDLAIAPAEPTQRPAHLGSLAAGQVLPLVRPLQQFTWCRRFHPSNITPACDTKCPLPIGCSRFTRRGTMPPRAVAQLGSALALGARGRRFESGQPDTILSAPGGCSSTVELQPSKLVTRVRLPSPARPPPLPP